MALEKKPRGRLLGNLRFLRDNGHKECEKLGWYGEPGSDDSILPRIKINGDTAFRIFFCEGPLDLTPDVEMTMLVVSKKEDGENTYTTAPARAVEFQKAMKTEEQRTVFPLGDEKPDQKEQ